MSESEIRIDLTKKIGRFELLLDIPIVKQGSADLSSLSGRGHTCMLKTERIIFSFKPKLVARLVEAYSRIDLINTPEADLLINFEAESSLWLETIIQLQIRLYLAETMRSGLSLQSTMYYLGFNAPGPMQNPNLRRAIGYAIDQEYICEAEMVSMRPCNPSISPQSRPTKGCR